MNPQWLDSVEILNWLVARLPGRRRTAILTAAGVVPAAAAVLLFTAGQIQGHLPCHAGSTKGQDNGQVENAITLGPKSHASFKKSTGTLLVHVWRGDALLRYPQSVAASVVVTAGYAQLSHIEAVVCVGVRKERTVVEVISGTTTFTQLRTGVAHRQVEELTLQAGDRVEIGTGPNGVQVRYVVGRMGSGCGI
jgi:ferric-dicitrate binding protein FerR (iron transport regulator)